MCGAFYLPESVKIANFPTGAGGGGGNWRYKQAKIKRISPAPTEVAAFTNKIPISDREIFKEMEFAKHA